MSDKEVKQMAGFAADMARLWLVVRHQLPAATGEIGAASEAGAETPDWNLAQRNRV